MPDLSRDLGPDSWILFSHETADRVLTQAALVVLRYKDHEETTAGGAQACDDIVEHLRALAKRWGVTL